jgi:aerobic-type carbon monoxide dehydrogenase small subunit (CoxS/CutS family)
MHERDLGVVGRSLARPDSFALIAEYDHNTETIIIQGATQNPYTVRSYISNAMGIPVNKVRVIQTAIGGVLCRCTGYRQIIEAVILAASRMGIPK